MKKIKKKYNYSANKHKKYIIYKKNIQAHHSYAFHYTWHTRK